MTSTSSVVLLLSLLAICLSVSAQLCIPSNGGNATSVIGQFNFTNAGSGPLLNELSLPSSFAIDPSSQKVYVSDTSNSRILRYASTSVLVNNATAELLVFGGGSICSNSTLRNPDQITISGDWMFIADTNNARVVKITGITIANATLTSISTTFGQQNSSTCSLTNDGSNLNDFLNPTGVAITNNGSLYVSDGALNSQTINCYIKRFDNATNTTNYPTPNNLLGDGTCSNPTPNATATSISSQVYHLFHDNVNGHLYAADYGYKRVILYKNVASKTNGTAVIDTVFGQSNATTTSVSTCGVANLYGPYGVFYDSLNDVLIVSDSFQNRVVTFASPGIASSGAPIANVLGVANTSLCNPTPASATADTFNLPTGLLYSIDFPGVRLLVADQSNNRALRFECANATFSGTVSQSGTIPLSSVGSNSTLPITSVVANSTATSGVVTASSGLVNSTATSVVANATATSVVANATATSVVANATATSGAVAASSGAIAASSGAVAASSGAVAASSGAVAASSGAVAASSGAVAASSGAVAASSGAVAASSGAVAASSGVVAPSDSASGALFTESGTPSQSSTPSNTLQPQTESNTPVIPPPVESGSAAVAAVCGNGVVENAEVCDPGSAVPRTKCCTSVCTNLGVGAVCGPATSKCMRRPKCRRSLGSISLVCTPGLPKKVGAKCGKGGLFSRKTCKADGTCSA